MLFQVRAVENKTQQSLMAVLSLVFGSGICNFIRGLNFGSKVCHTSAKHVPQRILRSRCSRGDVYVGDISLKQTERARLRSGFSTTVSFRRRDPGMISASVRRSDRVGECQRGGGQKLKNKVVGRDLKPQDLSVPLPTVSILRPLIATPQRRPPPFAKPQIPQAKPQTVQPQD